MTIEVILREDVKALGKLFGGSLGFTSDIGCAGLGFLCDFDGAGFGFAGNIYGAGAYFTGFMWQYRTCAA